MKKKKSMNKMVGDVPGYLVFIITYLCALLGVTFFGANFILMRETEKAEPYVCDVTVEPTDSNISKWMAWVPIVFKSSIANSFLIWNYFSMLLKYIPDWIIFYGMAILFMIIIPICVYPVSILLVLYASIQKCPGFKDLIHYAIPPVYFYEFCDRKDEVWEYDDLMTICTTLLFKVLPWLFHMVFHLAQSIFFFILNLIIWGVASSVISFTILWKIVGKPFLRVEEIFKVMGEYTTSLSAIMLSTVLYGAFLYLSPYVFIGFCIAAVIIVSRETLAELIKPNK
jgi:hypothetical protein